MTIRGDRAAVLEALADIRQGMEVDGYRLDVDDATLDRLSLQVIALDGACEECLAPPLVLKMMVSGDLERAYEPEEIDVRLPTSAAH